MKVKPHLFVFDLATIRVFFSLFGTFRATIGIGVGVRFKNFFGTYQCSQSTLVLEVQSDLFGVWLDIAILMKTKSSTLDFDFD